MNKLLILGTIAAAVALGGCQTDKAAPQQPEAKQLSQAEMVALLSGNTEKWDKGAGYYAADGTMIAVWDKKEVTGKWRVRDDGILCTDIKAWFKDGKEHCKWRYSDGGANVLTYDMERKKSLPIPRESYQNGNRICFVTVC